VILDNGKSRLCFPWIEHDIELADLQDPKFLPTETTDHTSNWFDKQRFEFNDIQMRHIQPSTLESGPDLDPPAHSVAPATEARSLGILGSGAMSSGSYGGHPMIMKYLAARKLHQEARAVHGNDP
jgi:hypothetical protein